MGKSAAELYKERQRRVRTAMEGGLPDRVPIPYMATDFHAAYAGYTIAETVYDADKLEASVKKCLMDFEPDCFDPQHIRNLIGPTIDIIDYQPMDWPGGRIGADVPIQYHDKEFMAADEYDELIHDPSGFFLRKLLPRTSSKLEGLAKLPFIPGMLYLGLPPSISQFGHPEVKEALDALHEAGKQARYAMQRKKEFLIEMAGLGYPAIRGGQMTSAFDYIIDFFRGTKSGFLDIYRHSDKLLEAIDAWVNYNSANFIKAFAKLPNKVLFIPLHWAMDGFMSEDHFKTFYWPQMRRIIMMAIDNGLTPMPFWEGDCTSRLEIIADVPPGKCVYCFEKTDIFRAKQILGDIVCIRGGVPGSLLITGSASEVEEHCRKLIDVVGKGGAYIMDGGAGGIPRESRVENVKAMFHTVKTHGVY
jgi:uroporphyrinogen-III decarboxylase